MSPPAVPGTVPRGQGQVRGQAGMRAGRPLRVQAGRQRVQAVQVWAGRYDHGQVGTTTGGQVRPREGRYERRQAGTTVGRQVQPWAGRYNRGWAGTSAGGQVRPRVGTSAHGECPQPHLLYQINLTKGTAHVNWRARCFREVARGAGEYEPAGTNSTAGFVQYRGNDGSWRVIPTTGTGSAGLGTVWENPTRGLPVSNPSAEWQG